MSKINDCYSTHTGEHITLSEGMQPAEWMGRAGVDVPEYDPQKQSAFWRDGAWVLVEVDLSKREEFL